MKSILFFKIFVCFYICREDRIQTCIPPRLQTGPLQNQLAYFALLRAPGGIRTHIVTA